MKKGLQIEPKYYFAEQMMKYDPKVYGDYIYLENKGFIEIPPLSLRLPRKISKKLSLIEKKSNALFS